MLDPGGVVHDTSAIPSGDGKSLMTWYLKKGDGEIYGPVDLSQLKLWATDGRVAPDDALSKDKQSWIPAPEVADLGMDWTVTVRENEVYGPLHLLAFRDLLLDGQVSRRSQIAHKQTGQTLMLCEALLPVLLAENVRVQTQSESLVKRADEAEKRVADLQAKPAAGVPGRDSQAQLKKEIKEAASRKDELHQEIQRLQKMLEDERAAAQRREQELREKLAAVPAAAAVAGATAQGEVAEWKKRFEDAVAAARTREKEFDAQVRDLKMKLSEESALSGEVEKWKKLYENVRGVAQAEKARVKEAQQQSSPPGSVPKAQLEEVERRLAQVERSYQQLLRTLNRNMPQPTTATASGRPDQLRRRDIG